MSDDDDEALIELVSRFDPEAMRRLYRRFARSVYGIAMKILRDSSAAEDAAQDAFLRIWKGSGSFRSEKGSAAAWIGRVARNTAIDHLRRRRSVSAERSWRESPVESAVSESSDPENEAEFSLRLEALRSALLELPRAQAQALNLAFYEGMTHRQIAEALGIPLGTAKTRIRDAMLALRSRLRKEGEA